MVYPLNVKRVVLSLGATGAALYAATALFERALRRRMFTSGPWHPAPPEAVGVPFEEAWLYTADGLELQGWFFRPVPERSAELPTLLFCHGTSYNASFFWSDLSFAHDFGSFLRAVGCNFLLFDYRGFGRNPGTATEAGTYLDANAALAYLYNRPDVDPRRVVYYGFSLGTGVATDLALREPPAGLILRAPFTSVRDLAMERVGRLRPFLLACPWLPRTRYDNEAKIRRLRCPLLIMHADADTTVPQWMGRRLYQVAPEPKRFVELPGYDHRDIPVHLIAPAIRSFVEEHIGVSLPAYEPEPPARHEQEQEPAF